MSLIEPYVAVAVQNEVVPVTRRADLKVNLDRCLSLIDRCALRFSRAFGEDVRLVAFPEYFLQDWRAVTAPWAEGEVDPLDVCVSIPGEETDRLGRRARSAGIFIAGQALEVLPEFPGYYFNCGFVIGPDGEVIYKRHKSEHAGYLMYASPHDVLDEYLAKCGVGRSPSETLFPVVQTEIGNLGMCMCYEMLVPEIHRELVANGAEVVIRPTAETDLTTHEPRKRSQVLDRARAMENAAYYVVPHLGPSRGAGWAAEEWAGASTIIGYDGLVLAEAHTAGETLIGAVVDIDRLRRVRRRGSNSLDPSMPTEVGHGLPLFRPELYEYHRRASFPPNTWHDGPQRRDEKRALIERIVSGEQT